MPIMGWSAMEFETKKQRSNYFRSVNTIINDGTAARPEWAKVPITFTEEDFRLKSAIHNDAMVIEVNIAGWVIGKVSSVAQCGSRKSLPLQTRSKAG
jgi:hypothetical protein